MALTPSSPVRCADVDDLAVPLRSASRPSACRWSPRRRLISVSGIAHLRSALTSRAADSGDALARLTPGILRTRGLSGRGVVGHVGGRARLAVGATGGLQAEQPVALGGAGVDGVGASEGARPASPGSDFVACRSRSSSRHRTRRSSSRAASAAAAGAAERINLVRRMWAPLGVSGHGFEWGTWPGLLPKMIPQRTTSQVGHRKHHAAGVPAVLKAMKMSQEQMGVRRTALTLLRVNQPTGFDCPGCAWPDPGHTHTAEFCENGAKAVAEEATLRRVDRDFFAQHGIEDLRRPHRLLAGAAGPTHRADVQARRRRPLRADRLGGRLHADRRAAALPAHAGRRGVLHLGPYVERGGVPLPADGAPLRHQQPARLLEHVPRVQRCRARPLDRHRQGLGAAGGHLRRRPDHGRRAEPRHQPPADALRAGAGQEQRRLHRQHQPARRGRAAHLPQPADPEGAHQGQGPHRRLPPGASVRRPGAVRGDGEADRRGRGGRRAVHRDVHLGVRRVPRAPREARLGRGGQCHRADPGWRSSGSRRSTGSPTASSSAGPWA